MTQLRVYDGPPGAPRFVFAHGAGAGSGHPWMVRVAGGLCARGITVITFDFDYVAAGRKWPDKAPVLEARYREVVAQVTARDSGKRVAIGGKSMGGRIASQIAAYCTDRVACLALFGYPLHPPGKPDQRRDAHLSSGGAPLLLIQGARDPFGDEGEITALALRIGATLHLVPLGDHSLSVPKRSGLDAAAVEHDALDAAARFIAQHVGGQSRLPANVARGSDHNVAFPGLGGAGESG